jgi:hypothetical protein
LFANHAKRKVLVALRGEDESQACDVFLAVFAVSRGRAPRLDQAFTFQEAKLGNGGVGEVNPQPSQHLTDAQK